MNHKPCPLFTYKEKYFTKIFIMNLVILCLVLLLVISSIIFKYKTYFQTKAIVSLIEDNYYLQIVAPINKIDSLVNNNQLIIDNKKYAYVINSISEKLEIENNFQNYQVIILEINLEEEKKINNYLLDVKFLEEDKQIIYYFADYLT